MHAALTAGTIADRIPLLLPAVEASASISHKLLGSRHPELLRFDARSWCFHMTIAGLQAAIMAFAAKTGGERAARLEARLNDEIERWDGANGAGAMADCHSFVSQMVTSDSPSADERGPVTCESLGLWVLSRLYRHTPSLQEAAPAGPIGYLMMKAFADWWERPVPRRRG